MITRLKYITNPLALFLLLSTVFLGCDDTFVEDGIPQVYVEEIINLDNFQFNALNNLGGTVYINGGVRGIIVYRKNLTEYTAFERNCTFQPMSDCATVSVDESSLFLLDSCCSSTFDFGGFPTGGPADIPLRIYNTYVNGRLLTITSDGIR